MGLASTTWTIFSERGINVFLPTLTRTDFTGEGFSDLVWQNTATGDVSLWFMNGSQWPGGYALPGIGIALAWKIAGIADLNKDGSPDLIWRNQQTGDVTCWFLTGTDILDFGAIASGIPQQWKIVGPH